ncbi:MAG TPA: DUF5305 family protein [Sphingobacteriaceae bacterium]|nr:DUF5305 family protein [Sphingobacteriaceae bacterium]
MVTRPSRHRRGVAGGGSQGKSRKGFFARLLPVLVVLLLPAAWITFTDFTTPTTVTTEEADLSVDLEANFTTWVLPATSALYPEPEPLENEPFFYMRLMESLTLSMEAVLKAGPDAQVQGTTAINARIIAPERWQRDFVLQEPEPFTVEPGDERAVVLQEELLVPITEFQSFISLVEEETRVMPRGDYRIEIRPVIEVAAENSAASLSENFELSYGFSLAGNTLNMDGQNQQRRSAQQGHPVQKPNTVGLLGRRLPVPPVRYGGAALLLVALAGTGLGLLERRKEWAALPEMERLERKYRARLVNIQADQWPLPGRVMVMGSFRDLVRMADLYEQPIFKMRDVEMARFMVLEGDTVYVYSVLPDPEPAQAALGQPAQLEP